MKNVLKTYNMEIRAVGPVHIGSGQDIGKKEYAFSSEEKKIYVMDTVKMYRLLEKKGIIKVYEKFLLQNSNVDLGTWLENKNIRKNDYMDCVRYCLDTGDAVHVDKSKLEIKEHIKDSYNMPYVPGSSVKGMLRTILLAYDIYKDRKKYSELICDIRNAPDRGNKNSYLKKETEKIEATCYRTLQRENTKPHDAVNDVMSGMIVSDSEPLSLSSLTLCQRTELHVTGTEKRLNVLREVIKPGTVIRCKITIDTSVCKYTKEDIEEAIKVFGEIYYNCFLQKYQRFTMPEKNMAWLGGGVGFVSKTEIYPLFDYSEGIEISTKVFKAIKVPDKHKHYKDEYWGVSPHICKVTYYKGECYQMGLCRIRLEQL